MRANDSLYQIVPWCSTDLEVALCKLAPFDGTIDPVIPGITTNKLGTAPGSSIPDDYVPWLLQEYGGEWIQEWVSNPQQCITEALFINRSRGTRAAVNRAFNWLGFGSPTIFQEPQPTIHFPEWQIDPGAVIGDLATIFNLWKIAQQVQPIRCRFRRMWHGENVPAWILDGGFTDGNYGGTLDNAILDTYSGISFDSLGYSSVQTGLIVSFRQYVGDSVSVTPPVPQDGLSQIAVAGFSDDSGDFIVDDSGDIVIP